MGRRDFRHHEAKKPKKELKKAKVAVGKKEENQKKKSIVVVAKKISLRVPFKAVTKEDRKNPRALADAIAERRAKQKLLNIMQN